MRLRPKAKRSNSSASAAKATIRSAANSRLRSSNWSICARCACCSYENAEQIAEKIIALFDKYEFDVCTLFYSRFRSVIAQIQTAQQIIPPVFDTKTADALNGAVYEFEPESEDILHELLPRNLAVQILRALLENAASFYGAQMSAMDNATRNAGDMIRKQTLTYNRTRQAMITKELIEIISGAEAL